MRKWLRHPLLIFFTVIIFWVSGIIVFIQSHRFARLTQKFAYKYLPHDLGIRGEFKDFSIKLFPPGLSINMPEFKFDEKNIAGIPGGSALSASRIDFHFQPLQMFSREIRVHRIVVIKGKVNLVLIPAPVVHKKKQSWMPQIRWEDLVKIRTDALELRDTEVHVRSVDPDLEVSLHAPELSVSQWISSGTPGYEIAFTIEGVEGKFPKSWPVPYQLSRMKPPMHMNVKARMRLNAKGVQLDDFQTDFGALSLHASGATSGNVLSPKSLKSEILFQLKGTGDEFYSFAKKSGLLTDKTVLSNARSGALADAVMPSPTGLFELTGKLKGDLAKPMETVQVSGVLLGKKIAYEQWSADSLKVEGSWIASPKGGDVEIASAVLYSAPDERVLVSQTNKSARAAQGGKVTLSNLKFHLDSSSTQTQDLKFKLDLEQAHIQWLVAPEIKKLFPLDFRVSGQIISQVHLNQNRAKGKAVPIVKWSTNHHVKLTVDHLQLDNQRLSEVRPLNKILNINTPIHIEGEMDLDSEAFRPRGVSLSLNKSQFKVGGKIDFNTGFDLQADGYIDLSEAGAIAGNTILGVGKLKVHVHGPSSRVLIHFDTELKQASYINLYFGDLKGRITIDEDPMILLFTGMSALKGQTPYGGNGKINLGIPQETIDFDISFSKGNIQDVIPVFSHLTDKIWWFPRALTGGIQEGRVVISGGLSLNHLKIETQVQGENWEYWGEKFRRAQFSGGYDAGKFYLSSGSMQKASGNLRGSISLDPDDTMDWKLSTQNWLLSDFDTIARLDTPIRGKISLESKGHGKIGSVESTTNSVISDFSVRGRSMPSSDLNIKSSQGVIFIKGNGLGGQGSLDVVYRSKPDQDSSVRLAFNHFDFSPALLLVNSKLMQDQSLAGSITAVTQLKFKTGQWQLASGKIEIDEYLLRKKDFQLELESPVSLTIYDGSFAPTAIALKSQESQAKLNISSDRSVLDGTIIGKLNLGIAEFFTPVVNQIKGAGDLDFTIAGTWDSPVVSGRMKLNDASFLIPSVDAAVENVYGVALLKQNLITVQGFEGDLANARVNGSGVVELFVDHYPRVDLKAQLHGNKLKIYPFQFVKVHGGLHIHGTDLPYLIEGKMIIDSALSKEKVMNQNQGPILKTAKYTPPPNQKTDNDYPKFKLQIQARGDQGIIVQNDLFDCELKADVTVVNTLEAPRLLGTAEVLQTAVAPKLTFKDRIFQIQSATMNFDNPTTINPSFNLVAQTEVNKIKVQLYSSGRLDSMRMEFTSNPALPQNEIISLLAMGLTSEEMQRLRQSGGGYDQGEAASLLLHSLDFNRDVQNKTGFQIDLDEAVNTQSGTSIFRSKTDTDSVSSPKIVIRRKIGKRLDVSVGSTVGVGMNSQKEVNAELKVTPGFSVIGVWDAQENTSLQQQRASTSYGVDLKVQKRFK